jgi:elongation factor Tu
VPVPERYVDAPFPMAVENSLTITGRGTVVTGAIERGQVRVGDMIELIGLGAAVKSVVTSVETFGKTMDSAQAGDNAALLLRGVGRHLVRRGQVLAAPGSLHAHQRSTPARPSRSARAAALSARARSPPCSTEPAGARLAGPAPAARGEAVSNAGHGNGLRAAGTANVRPWLLARVGARCCFLT